VKLSCVIITKNEERNIERCLKSVIPVADEIIVIDSFSNDSTMDICERYSVRFEQVEWLGYSDTKNYGNTRARYPYILSLDADEALSQELQQEITRLKNNNSPADAYLLKRITCYCGKWIKHSGWYPDRKLRIWNKELGKWQGHVHEKLVLDSGAVVERLENNILHYSYYSVEEHLDQIERFTTLMAEENYLKNKGAGFFKLVCSPLVKFLNVYFFRLGILDGYSGLRISILSSYATYLKYKKTRLLKLKI
jgi:glycosyltransferase involved in cell wall biosynthesis